MIQRTRKTLMKCAQPVKHLRSLIWVFLDRMCLLQPPDCPKWDKQEPLPYWVDVQADLSFCRLYRCQCRLSRTLSMFFKTDSICHSSLPRTVLEKVTLTTIQFRIYPRTKVDFNVCILVRHWRAVHTKVVQLVLDLWRELLRKPALIYVQTTKAQISLRVRAGWSAPLLFAVALFFSTKKRLKT